MLKEIEKLRGQGESIESHKVEAIKDEIGTIARNLSKTNVKS
jgi:hypothetical protein